MSGVITPIPNTPSWFGAQFIKKHLDKFTFTYRLGGEEELTPEKEVD
jgi:hypothetical protein